MAADIHFLEALPVASKAVKDVIVIDILGDIRTFKRVDGQWQRVVPLSLYPGWRIAADMTIQTAVRSVAETVPIQQGAVPTGKVVDMNATGKVIATAKQDATAKTLNAKKAK